jgi:hypothetical protein
VTGNVQADCLRDAFQFDHANLGEDDRTPSVASTTAWLTLAEVGASQHGTSNTTKRFDPSSFLGRWDHRANRISYAVTEFCV